MNTEFENTYKTIARQIATPNGQCVLILGPELAVDNKGIGYKTFFRKLVPPTSKYFDAENLFLFKDKSDTRFVMDSVIDYYSKVGDPSLLEMVSRIPFPLIINVCPDLALNKVFERKGIPYSEAYFAIESKVKFDPIISIPSKEKPVIYNIFGSINVEQSLIFTHKRLYETIEYLLPKKSLPDNIELFLKETANSFIFLGFKFDSWHYQLVCHKLGINTNSDSKINISSPNAIDNENVTIVMNNLFDMKFTSDNPMQCLHNIIECCENEHKNTLRPKDPNGSYSTFVSYARKDDKNPERENVVDLIQQCFTENANGSLFSLFRDRKDLKYGDSIDSFMTHIGVGKTVIRVISDKYLKSIYCMIEAYRIQHYKDDDKRVFTIVMNDADIHSADSIEKYKQYWFDQCQDLLKNPSQLENGCYDDYVTVYRFIDNFITTLKDQVYLNLDYTHVTKVAGETSVTILDTKKPEFDVFMDQVLAKLKTE